MSRIEEGPLFRNTDPPTSRAAADKISKRAGSWHVRILECLRCVPRGGHTCGEMCLAYFDPGLWSTVSRRITSLLRAGLVEADGERDGQRVVKITDAGRRWID